MGVIDILWISHVHSIYVLKAHIDMSVADILWMSRVHSVYVLKAHFDMGVTDILWMSHVHSIYVLCPGAYFPEGSFLEITVSKL